MKICDLHTHSLFSDGSYTPTQIIDEAISLGLSAVALSDHNMVDGLPEFLAAARGKPIEAVPGAEFSVDYNGTELHLLGLFLSPAHFPEISRLMEDVIQRKDKSNRELIRALNQAGYAIDYDAIKSATPNGKFNRSQIAEALTRQGYTPSTDDAFHTLLSPEYGFYKEPKRLTFFDMLEFLRSIDAVPVLAHPFLKLDEVTLDAMLPAAKEKGLTGMECYYSEYDEQTTQTSLALVQKHGLLPSGGSDFHGTGKSGIFLGVGKGNLQIPYAWAEALKTAKG